MEKSSELTFQAGEIIFHNINHVEEESGFHSLNGLNGHFGLINLTLIIYWRCKVRAEPPANIDWFKGSSVILSGNLFIYSFIHLFQ